MRILVTNDDGVDSPGIHALAAALVADGHDVFVVAPTDDRSGAGASIGRSDRRRTAAGRAPGVGRAPRPPGARHRRAARHGGVRRLPRRVRRPARRHRVGHQPRRQHRPPRAALGHRRRDAHRRGLGIPGVAVSMEWSTDAASTTGTPPPAWPRRRSSGRPSPTATRASSTSTCRTCRSTRSWACARRSSRRPVRSGWRRPTCREGDLRIEFTGRADPAPGTDVALVAEGYVSVTPLISIVRGPARGRGRRHRRRARLSNAPGLRATESAR